MGEEANVLYAQQVSTFPIYDTSIYMYIYALVKDGEGCKVTELFPAGIYTSFHLHLAACVEDVGRK